MLVFVFALVLSTSANIATDANAPVEEDRSSGPRSHGGSQLVVKPNRIQQPCSAKISPILS